MAEEAEFAAEEKRYLAEKKAAEELAAEKAEGAEGDDVAVDKSEVEEPARPTRIRLDKEVEASGFGRHMQKELEDVSEALRSDERSDIAVHGGDSRI